MGICEIDTSGRWKVDGISIFTPDSVAFSNSSKLSSDSKRTESGKQYLTWVRPTIRSVKITYSMITGAEVAVLHGLMQGREFTFDYEDDGAKTMKAFATKDSYTQHRLNVYPDEGGIYKNYSITIEEI